MESAGGLKLLRTSSKALLKSKVLDMSREAKVLGMREGGASQPVKKVRQLAVRYDKQHGSVEKISMAKQKQSIDQGDSLGVAKGLVSCDHQV